MRDIVVIAHDIRSTHNIGSLLRTAEGLGVGHLYLTGYTPYPSLPHDDPRLPHIANKLDAQIHKTALGTERIISWSPEPDIYALIEHLQSAGYRIAGLEQSSRSIALPMYVPSAKIALLLGREVEGVATDLLELCDDTLEIPMFGQKESFNVVQAAAMALYALRFYNE